MTLTEKEKNYLIIQKIVKKFNLETDADPDNLIEYIFESPSAILAELIVRYKKREMEKEDMVPFLVEKLNITEEKAKNIKSIMEDVLLSDIERSSLGPGKDRVGFKSSKKQNKGPDKYREPIE